MATVVVVGDGPSPEGMGWGEQIDRQDCVVRMWDHQWQNADDYGGRYDYGMITSAAFPLRAFRRPGAAWLFYNARREGAVTEINDTPVITLNDMRWYDRAIAAGAHPARKVLKFTRGFAAAAGVLRKFSPQRMIMIGMDMMRDGVTTAPRHASAALAYRKELRPAQIGYLDTLPGGLEREGPHDLSAEAELIRALAAEAGTELSWGF